MGDPKSRLNRQRPLQKATGRGVSAGLKQRMSVPSEADAMPRIHQDRSLKIRACVERGLPPRLQGPPPHQEGRDMRIRGDSGVQLREPRSEITFRGLASGLEGPMIAMVQEKRPVQIKGCTDKIGEPSAGHRAFM